jgi:hypothetical protein
LFFNPFGWGFYSPWVVYRAPFFGYGGYRAFVHYAPPAAFVAGYHGGVVGGGYAAGVGMRGGFAGGVSSDRMKRENGQFSRLRAFCF